MSLWAWLFHIHTLAIQQPLRSLYFRGPEALGFWGGAAIEDICYSLTATPSTFWTQHMQQCMQLCEQKLDAFTTAVNFVIYFVILVRLVNGLMFHVCFTRPVLAELRRMREPTPTALVQK